MQNLKQSFVDLQDIKEDYPKDHNCGRNVILWNFLTNPVCLNHLFCLDSHLYELRKLIVQTTLNN